MKYVKTFEKFQVTKRKEEIIKESVLQVNDILKVKTMIDVPQSLINAYTKKVKDVAGQDLKTFFGYSDLAEEIVKYINTHFLNVDKIPANALIGGSEEVVATQEEPVNVDVVSQEEAPVEEAPLEISSEETEAQEEETANEPTDGDFEEPVNVEETEDEFNQEDEEELPQ